MAVLKDEEEVPPYRKKRGKFRRPFCIEVTSEYPDLSFLPLRKWVTTYRYRNERARESALKQFKASNHGCRSYSRVTFRTFEEGQE